MAAAKQGIFASWAQLVLIVPSKDVTSIVCCCLACKTSTSLSSKNTVSSPLGRSLVTRRQRTKAQPRASSRAAPP
ncbi:hypothetical protein PF005_g25817 [Phytophthora fragariae]|uniref:Secreted protein n=1 Tax=Phytophthora fragariae TaxID=53985 RepID=A0A6A3QZ89_9STRA|nr:hypothetical protein PF003_g6928 [Phytophthora fragariae]KAE8923198.1 hypothetical protein PF009_g26552 [Phytophthora fragariae]KAE9082271.1 hypothetical protein PF006_g26946 [Phytophthora fragariae]KAE9084363.1 hypothetical protein PF007_g21548 [Phytophthora fragariae]KAE9174540.1 hypothetical protein PF005_g25817 [Phytophthora fragariae]